MKKIIDGFLYDTETAAEVASTRYGYWGDASELSETLYITTKGNWFVYGNGGPMSKWGKDDFGRRTRGDGFEILTRIPGDDNDA